MNYDVAVINRVRVVRHSLGLTQESLAHKVNVTRQTIINIEKGRLNPSILLCLCIARALNSTVSELFYIEDGAAAHLPAEEPCDTTSPVASAL